MSVGSVVCVPVSSEGNSLEDRTNINALLIEMAHGLLFACGFMW